MSLIRRATPLVLGIVLAVAVGALFASALSAPRSPVYRGAAYVQHVSQPALRPAPVIIPDGADVGAPAADVPNIVLGATQDVPEDLGQTVCGQLAAGESRDEIVEGLEAGPEAFALEEARGLVDQAPSEWCPRVTP